MPRHVMTDDGESVVTQQYGDGEQISFDLNDLPEASQRYLLIRGGRKFISDVAAGFEGDDRALKAETLKRWSDLRNGLFRQRRTTAIPTKDQLAKAIAVAAPEASEEAIMQRIRDWHPDCASTDKERNARRKRLRDRMTDPRLRDALAEAGFEVPVPTADDLFADL